VVVPWFCLIFFTLAPHAIVTYFYVNGI